MSIIRALIRGILIFLGSLTILSFFLLIGHILTITSLHPVPEPYECIYYSPSNVAYLLFCMIGVAALLAVFFYGSDKYALNCGILAIVPLLILNMLFINPALPLFLRGQPAVILHNGGIYIHDELGIRDIEWQHITYLECIKTKNKKPRNSPFSRHSRFFYTYNVYTYHVHVYTRDGSCIQFPDFMDCSSLELLETINRWKKLTAIASRDAKIEVFTIQA